MAPTRTTKPAARKSKPAPKLIEGSNPKVDGYLGRAKAWQAELSKLREIVASCPLTEEFKWGHPCYTLDGKNVVLIHAFKEYCAILFVKGALLVDAHGLLIQQTENVQAARQLRFTSLTEINELEPEIKSYIAQAIEIEKAGLKVATKPTSEFKMVDEFASQLEANARLKEAFYALTPGRQRAYLLYFASAKQPKTREARVEKYFPKILEGLGLED